MQRVAGPVVVRVRPRSELADVVGRGLPRIRALQDLRHTHATLLLVGGEHPKVIQERLRHHSHSFTSDTYQHVTPGMDDAAAARFDGMAFGFEEPPVSDDEEAPERSPVGHGRSALERSDQDEGDLAGQSRLEFAGLRAAATR